MSILGDAIKAGGGVVSKAVEDIIDEAERSGRYAERLAQRTGLLGRGGWSEMDPTRPFRRRPPKRNPKGPGSTPGTSCTCVDPKTGSVVAGKIPYTITSWFRIAAGALSADTELGDFFLTANSAFFTTNNTFPVAFYQATWSGMVSAQIPAAETETAAVISTAYICLFQKTEYARYSVKDLGFALIKEQPLTTSGVAAASVPWPDEAEYDYDWPAQTTFEAQFRLPKAVTTVNPVDAGTQMTGFIDG